MQTKTAYKPWLHANHGWPTLIPYGVRIISDGLNRAENTKIWWGWVKMCEIWSTNEKLGLIFWGKVQDGIRSMPLYRCFQRANFDTPHGHHEFCMQFWPTRTDSHTVSHFKELWLKPYDQILITDVVSLHHVWSTESILDSQWSKIDLPLCQGHLECIVCAVKCYPVWNTLITFDQLQNILIVIFDRDEEKRRRMAKKILEFCDRCCYWA